METKTKSLRWLLPLLSALFLLSGLTACDSTEDSVEDSAKPKVPIADGDWQVVPATGGTITKDSISITFPSGTFAEETKVAITEIQKGKIGGEYEASKFYQIAMPSNAGKTMAVKMKSRDKNDDISFVMNSPGFCISSCEEKTIETLLQTNYSNGEYSATIPAFDQTNSVEDIVYLTIGLGHMISYNSTNTSRTRGLFDEVLHEGKVNNVSYQIIFPWWTLCTNDKGTLVRVEMKAHIINTYVQQALTKIFDLGFKITGDRYLKIVFDNSKNWGGFSNSKVNKKWSELSLGIGKLLEEGTEESDIKCTVIHELFHFFQSEYDKRCQFEKGRLQLDGGGEDLEMAEMGAVWSEHLFNDGQLNAKFLMEDVLFGVFQDLMGLTNTVERWKAEDWVLIDIEALKIKWLKLKQLGPRYQNQGYSMAPLLYYLCSTKEMEAFKFDNKSVEELHKLWSTHFSNTKQTRSTLDILYEWAKYSHDSNFFSGDQIDDYYLKLLKGELVKGLDIFRYYDFFGLKNLKNSFKDKYVDKLFDNIPFEGTVYPFGYAFRTIQLKGLKNESLKDKKLVIKQEKEGMQTYLLTANRTDKKYEQIGTVAKGQDSIVVSGSKLESYRKADGTFDQYFFVITTRTINSTSDTGSKPWKANVELQDEKKEEQPVVSPNELEFPAEGGTKRVTIKAKGFKKFNHKKIDPKYSSWLSAQNVKGGYVDITAQPNTTGEKREGEVLIYVMKDDNTTEADFVYLPVKVTQEPGSGSVSEIWDKRFFNFYSSVKILQEKEPQDRINDSKNYVEGGFNSYLDIYYDYGDFNVSAIKSGNIYQVTAKGYYEYKSYNEKCEDVITFTYDRGDGKNGMIRNFEATSKHGRDHRDQIDRDNYNEYRNEVYKHFKLKDFPITVNETHSSETTWTTCKVENLDASYFIEYEYNNAPSYYNNSNRPNYWPFTYGSYTYTYVHSLEDNARLSFSYDRPNTTRNCSSLRLDPAEEPHPMPLTK